MLNQKFINAVLTTLVLFSATSDMLYAQMDQQQKVKLASVTIEGISTADANFIKLNSGLVDGEDISGEDIQKAIHNLWDLNMFSDIDVVVEKQVGSSLYLLVKVKEYPRLESIELQGNKKIKKKNLEKELNFYKGQMLSPQQIKRSEQRIKALYAEKGHLLAEVESRLLDGQVENKKILRFAIREGNKVQIEGISFGGNTAFEDKKLRKQLKDTEENGFLFFGGGDFDPDKYQEDLRKLIAFYRKEGFRDAEVVRDSIYYGPQKRDMFIKIWVDEGQRYYFGDITWEGNEIYPTEQLAMYLDFNRGDVYNREKVDKATQERIGSLYYDSGYIYALITPQEKPVAKDTVDLHFRITEGNAVKIRKIHIAGNTKTKEKVIRRELRIFPNDVFSKDALIRSTREIFVLNYFADVRPDVQPVSDAEVDVLLEVDEKSTDTANMSAGFSERDKFIGSVGVTMNNFFGNGQTASVDMSFGRSYRAFNVGFTEPWFRDSPTLVGVNLFDTKRTSGSYINYGYDQRSQGASLRLGRRLRWPDTYFRTDWIYRIDRTELSNFDPIFVSYNSRLTTQQWPLVTSAITQIITRNSLDRPEFPTQGSRVSLTTSMAGGLLGGNTDYIKNVLRADWFSPVFLNMVFMNSFQMGYLQGFGDFAANVPYFELFFMGGEGLSRSISLRGYDDPLSGTTTTQGGQTMFKYTSELRVPISPNPTIFALAFAEAGNTWTSLDKTDPSDLRRSVGIGVRVFMPMLGMIGFDYAYGFDNIDRITGEKFGSWKPHFVFGRGF